MHQVLDGCVLAGVHFAKRVWKVLFGVAARVPRPTRATTARVPFTVVAVRADEVWHRDWAQHPSDTAVALLDNRVWNLLWAVCKLHHVVVARKLELVFRLGEASFGERFVPRTDSVLVAAAMVERNVPYECDEVIGMCERSA